MKKKEEKKKRLKKTYKLKQTKTVKFWATEMVISTESHFSA